MMRRFSPYFLIFLLKFSPRMALETCACKKHGIWKFSIKSTNHHIPRVYRTPRNMPLGSYWKWIHVSMAWYYVSNSGAFFTRWNISCILFHFSDLHASTLQIPLLRLLQSPIFKQKRFGNMFFWSGLLLGLSGIISLYARDYYKYRNPALLMARHGHMV